MDVRDESVEHRSMPLGHATSDPQYWAQYTLHCSCGWGSTALNYADKLVEFNQHKRDVRS